MRVWLALATAAALCPAASAATHRHFVETDSSGAVRAEFSYDHVAGTYRFARPHLTIERMGNVILSVAVRPLDRGYLVQPANFFAHRRSLSVRDLDGGAEPEIALELYSAGAHCCWYTQVYRYAAASNAYSLNTHEWGNAGVRIADLDGDRLPEFLSGDDRFAYEFADFADSAWPIEVRVYRGGRFIDVTRRFPAKIVADARRKWRYAFRRDSNGLRRRGVLAAWAADECLLDRCSHAFRKLEILRRSGRLIVKRACPCDASPPAYLRHLRRFLRRTGYLR